MPLHRLEAFSDAVFAFAVTLLVVSLEVPKSAAELDAALRGFPAFGICFVFLAFIWVEHARFFKHFPLTDVLTVALNMLLLFVLLMYVFPLKFLFSALADEFFWHQPATSMESTAQVRWLMIVYGLGFLTVNLVLMGMRVNARRQQSLHAPGSLSVAQRGMLREGLLRNGTQAAVALASVLIAAFTRDDGRYSGMIYVLLLPASLLLAALRRRSAPLHGAHRA